MISVIDRAGRMAIHQNKITKAGEAFYAEEQIVCHYCKGPLRAGQVVMDNRFYDRIYHDESVFEGDAALQCRVRADADVAATIDIEVTEAIRASGGALSAGYLETALAEVTHKYHELRGIFVSHTVGGAVADHYHPRVIALGLLEAHLRRMKAANGE